MTHNESSPGRAAPSRGTPPARGKIRIGEYPWLDEKITGNRRRVIIDNDFAGDPDDHYQLVHHLLSPGVEIRGIIASHLAPGDAFNPGPDSTENAMRIVQEILDTMGIDAGNLLWRGATEAITDRHSPQRSEAALAIVAEAMREDCDTPLYVACGGGLTDIASAYLIEPKIADRLTLIWIGGPEYPGTIEPPGIDNPEYNLRIDMCAGQVVFNDSTLELWQIPRNIYRQCLVSDAELRARVLPYGPIGEFLYYALDGIQDAVLEHGGYRAETYALGDSPLVLLTALQSLFQPDPSSSFYTTTPAPQIEDDGSATAHPAGRPIRVYTQVDTRLMFEDMFLKLAEFAQWNKNT